MPQGCHPTGRQAREQRQLDQAARQAEREQARGKQQQEREVRAVLSRLLTQVAHLYISLYLPISPLYLPYISLYLSRLLTQVAHAARTRTRTSTRTLLPSPEPEPEP